MNVKTLTQIFLILAIILITLFFFYKYFYQTNNPIELVEKETVKEQDLTEKIIDNVIEDLTFENIGMDGNTFKIDSKYGEFSVDNENSVELTDVRATIKMDGTSGTSKELVFQTDDGSLAERFSVTLSGAKVTGNIEVSGTQIDFTNLPTSDPGVAGRLYRDGATVKISV